MFVKNVNENVTLRMLKSSENMLLFSLIDSNRAYLRQWLPWIDENTSPADSAQFISNAFELHANREALSAGIFYNEKLIGIIGFNTFDWRNQVGTIGYWLAEEAQGKGTMTQSVQALIEHGFNNLQLNRIQLFAAEGNHPSRAIAQRAGFTEEGILRENEWLQGKPIDQVLYRLLKGEWVKTP